MCDVTYEGRRPERQHDLRTRAIQRVLADGEARRDAEFGIKVGGDEEIPLELGLSKRANPFRLAVNDLMRSLPEIFASLLVSSMSDCPKGSRAISNPPSVRLPAR